MEELTFQVEIRKAETKGGLRALREADKIPAVVFGGEKPSLSILVEAKDLTRVKGASRANAIVTLKHAQGSDTVILKVIQRHPVNRKFLHVDFQRISLEKEIEVKVPIRAVGEAPGVKLQGGILEYLLREVEVKCLPTKIPDAIPVDISRLEIGHALHVKDIAAIPGVAVLTPPEQVILTVVAPKAEAEAPAAEAAPATGEPEVIVKGKKEEGEDAGAEKAEKGKEAPKKEAPKKEAHKKE